MPTRRPNYAKSLNPAPRTAEVGLAGERERGGTGTLSALAGFIWTVSPSLAIDGAVRAGRQDEALEEHVNLLELRLGLTWSFPVFRKNER